MTFFNYYYYFFITSPSFIITFTISPPITCFFGFYGKLFKNLLNLSTTTTTTMIIIIIIITTSNHLHFPYFFCLFSLFPFSTAFHDFPPPPIPYNYTCKKVTLKCQRSSVGSVAGGDLFFQNDTTNRTNINFEPKPIDINIKFFFFKQKQPQQQQQQPGEKISLRI